MVPGAHAVTTGVAVDPGAGSNIRIPLLGLLLISITIQQLTWNSKIDLKKTTSEPSSKTKNVIAIFSRH